MIAAPLIISHIFESALTAVGGAARRSLRRLRMRQLLRELSTRQLGDIGVSHAAWSREAAKWFWEA